MKKFSVVFCALALLAFSCAVYTPQAAAQAVFGSIFGTVTDPSGAAVPGVKVTVTSATKGTSTETTTNADGNYSVTHLIPDVYNVRAEGSGFKAFETKSIVVSADAAARVDGQFQVGGSTETVEVTAESPQLKTDRADVATILNEKAVEDLPLFNRNFTALVLASRLWPVSTLVTVTFASGTTACVGSVTTPVSTAVVLDCANALNVQRTKTNNLVISGLPP